MLMQVAVCNGGDDWLRRYSAREPTFFKSTRSLAGLARLKVYRSHIPA